MPNRAARRRAERVRRSAVRIVQRESGAAHIRPPESMSDRDKLMFLVAVATAGFENDTPVIVEGETVTAEDVEVLQALLEEIPVDYTGHVDLPHELSDFCSGARPPADAAHAWPDNIAAHDQAAAALLQFLSDEAEPTPATTAAIETLTNIGRTMPPDATVAVVLELTDGHVLATLLNPDGNKPVVAIACYGDDDPKRYNDPIEANVILLNQ